MHILCAYAATAQYYTVGVIEQKDMVNSGVREGHSRKEMDLRIEVSSVFYSIVTIIITYHMQVPDTG